VNAHGQAASSILPCVFDGPLLRDAHGKIVQYSSDEMKQRATAKEDVSGFVKQIDFRSTMVLKVLVSDSGKVICVKTISGIPIARRATEEAVRHWRFSRARSAGKPVSYVGWLEFTLCNTACSDGDYGVTLLK